MHEFGKMIEQILVEFDEKMGARPLARVIDNDIKTPLGRKLLFDEHNKGKVMIDTKEDSLDLIWQ